MKHSRKKGETCTNDGKKGGGGCQPANTAGCKWF
jgi:hypothetical protein